MSQGDNEAVNSQKIEDLSRRVEKLEISDEQQTELTYLIKEQQSISKIQGEQLEKYGQQFEKTNEVLTKIGTNLESLNKDISYVKDEMGGIHGRVDDLEKVNFDRLFDWNKFWKHFFYYAVPTLLVGLVLAFLVWSFGWK